MQLLHLRVVNELNLVHWDLELMSAFDARLLVRRESNGFRVLVAMTAIISGIGIRSLLLQMCRLLLIK